MGSQEAELETGEQKAEQTLSAGSLAGELVEPGIQEMLTATAQALKSGATTWAQRTGLGLATGDWGSWTLGSRDSGTLGSGDSWRLGLQYRHCRLELQDRHWRLGLQPKIR